MTAQIIQFKPRPNPVRDAQQACEAMLTIFWAPFFAWVEMLEDPIDWNAIKPKEPA